MGTRPDSGLSARATRRSFLRWCAAASGASSRRSSRRRARGAGPDHAQARRHAQGRLLHRGRHDGSASVGQQDRPAGLPQPLRAAAACSTPSSASSPAWPESWTQPDPKTLVFKLQPRREVPRRHRLQRRGRQVQLQPDEDGPEVGPQGRDGQHRLGGRGRLPHDPAQPEAARRIAAGRAHRSGWHDGLARRSSRSAARTSKRNAKGAGTGPVRVRRVGRRTTTSC